LTRSELTEAVYQAIGIPLKEADVIVRAIVDSIVRALRSGDTVEIRGFGSFRTRQRRARIGRNPRTGVRVESASEENSLLQTEQGASGTA
jgi:integration host factor subunit beta